MKKFYRRLLAHLEEFGSGAGYALRN